HQRQGQRAYRRVGRDSELQRLRLYRQGRRRAVLRARTARDHRRRGCRDRRGALVAIDPTSGDVLAFVSKPGYDPNLFVDGIDPANWQELNDSPDKPLLNRPLRGAYPPGSTIKPYLALAALTSGKRTPNQTIYDPGFFQIPGQAHKF